MKTLLFCTSYAETQGTWDERWGRWLKAIALSGVRADKVIIVDDGSPVLPTWPAVAVVPAESCWTSQTRIEIRHFADRRGQHINGEPFPGWYRSFSHAVLYGIREGFEKIIHIESDAFVISDRAIEFFNSCDRGWVGLWCPRHQWPESTLQIINRDQFATCEAFFLRPYSALLTTPDAAVEHLIPFTSVNKELVGDRYGEYRDNIPFGADYVSQVWWGMSSEYYWWMADKAMSIPTNDQYLNLDGSLAVAAEGQSGVLSFVRSWPTPRSDLPLTDNALAGHDVIFSSEGNAAALLRIGWSAPEADGIWTDGPTSVLTLPRPSQAASYELQVLLAPFTHPRRLRSQRLRLAINGVSASLPEIKDIAVFTVKVPWAVIALRPTMDLVFDMPDAARPVDVTGVEDTRRLGFSFRRMMLTPVAPLAAPGAVVAAPADTALVPREDLMVRFESLGENCEFGLVQRQCGVEPLGLLRFASAPLPLLLAALRDRFAGFGAPQNVVVVPSSNGREYMIEDRAFGFNYHAWVLVGEQTPEAVHAREVRRVPLLVRKLIEDLEAGEKIFVYHGMQPLLPAHAARLLAAIRAYGPGRLLWVETPADGRKPGTVEQLDAGFFRGTIDRFAPGEDAHDLSLECWVEICRNTLGFVAG